MRAQRRDDEHPQRADRLRQVGEQIERAEVGREGQEALHVGGAPADPAVALPGEPERIASPLRFGGRDGVHVAAEGEAAFRLLRSGPHH